MSLLIKLIKLWYDRLLYRRLAIQATLIFSLLKTFDQHSTSRDTMTLDDFNKNHTPAMTYCFWPHPAVDSITLDQWKGSAS